MSTGTLVKSGTKTVTTTPAPLVATSTKCRQLLVTVPSSNTNSVFLGLSDVDASGNGHELEPGKSWFMDVLDLAQIYVVVASGTESVSFSATS